MSADHSSVACTSWSPAPTSPSKSFWMPFRHASSCAHASWRLFALRPESGRPKRSSLNKKMIAFFAWQILGVEAIHTKDVRRTHALLVKHCIALRSAPIFRHCKLVLVFESNLAFESQHLLHALTAAGIQNWVSLSEGQQGSLGWLTVHAPARATAPPRSLELTTTRASCADQRTQGANVLADA